MASALLIAQRELKSFLTTWIGYIIVFASLLVNGLLFNTRAMGDEPKLSADVLYSFFEYSGGIAMVASVFLGMRLLAEERSQGTLVMFLTSPLTERQLIWGKFLSAALFFCLMQFCSLYMPALILLEGKVSLGHLFAGYLGTTLIGLAVLAISLFASAISPNQLIAGITAASITVILLIIWMLAKVVDAPLTATFSYLAIWAKHFPSFGRGLVHTEHVVYYLSLILFFIECSVRTLEGRRSEG